MRPGLHVIVQMLPSTQDMKAHASKSDNVYMYSFFSLCKTKGHIGAPHRAQAWLQLHLVHNSCTNIGSTNMSCGVTMQTFTYIYNKTTNPMLNECMYTIKLTEDFGGYSDVKQLHITPSFHQPQYYYNLGWREIQVCTVRINVQASM